MLPTEAQRSSARPQSPSPARAAWAEENINDDTKKWLDEDARYFFHQSLSTPCLDVLARCEGIYIEALQGRRMMDFHGNSVHQVGFSNPKVIQAIIEQLQSLSFSPRRFTNIPAIKLAKKLADLTSGRLSKVLFAPGGTSAIGIAMKVARVATGRFKTISMWDSYHGASLDAISIGGQSIYRQGIGPLLPGSEHVPPSNPSQCVWGCDGRCNLKCAQYVEYVLAKEGDIGAVIAEPIRSVPVVPPPDYWRIIREACDRHGALLILDEIPHCLGRTGKMFAYQHYDVVPDMLVLGKGLSGGVFPLAALLARENLDVMPEGALGHYTHEKNPVACAAALAAIEYIEAEGLVEHSRDLGDYALSRMLEMQGRHKMIGGVRGIGLLLGMELIRDKGTTALAAEEAESIMYRALSKGLNFTLSMGSIISLAPPLIISKDEMDQALSIIEECVAEAETLGLGAEGA